MRLHGSFIRSAKKFIIITHIDISSSHLVHLHHAVVEQLQQVGLEAGAWVPVDNQADVVGVGGGKDGVQEHVQDQLVGDLRVMMWNEKEASLSVLKIIMLTRTAHTCAHAHTWTPPLCASNPPDTTKLT